MIGGTKFTDAHVPERLSRTQITYGVPRRTPRAPAGNGRQRRSLTRKSQLLSMAEALSGLIPNADCRVTLVIRHRHPPAAAAAVICTSVIMLLAVRRRCPWRHLNLAIRICIEPEPHCEQGALEPGQQQRCPHCKKPLVAAPTWKCRHGGCDLGCEILQRSAFVR